MLAGSTSESATFQSYLSPGLTLRDPASFIFNILFQSYLSPGLTTYEDGKAVNYIKTRFQSYLSPGLTKCKRLAMELEKTNFNPTLVRV